MKSLVIVAALGVLVGGGIAAAQAPQRAQPVKPGEVPARKKVAVLAAARNLRAGKDAMGRSRYCRAVHEQRRERHSVRAAGRVRRPPARGGDACGAGQDCSAASAADHRARADVERVPWRDKPDALVRELQRGQQPRVAGRRSAGRQGSAADSRGAAAGGRATARHARVAGRPTRGRTAACTIAASLAAFPAR